MIFFVNWISIFFSFFIQVFINILKINIFKDGGIKKMKKELVGIFICMLFLSGGLVSATVNFDADKKDDTITISSGRYLVIGLMKKNW